MDKISKLMYENRELIEEKDRLSEELRAMISGREEWEAEVKASPSSCDSFVHMLIGHSLSMDALSKK